MCSGGSNTPLRVLGCPIQKSTDRRLVGTSPWLIAASHVFHRFSSPRHPPLALNNLGIAYKDARARYEILKKRRRARARARKTRRSPRERGRLRTFTTEDRTGTSDSSAPCANERCQSTRRVHQLGVQTRHGTNVREPSGIGLLRKEVIQPHLPVRLPCYDFTPIANPTFGSSVPEGSATDFGCCQLSWCDGRCVQGPGTYSPRRC
jgi:hypothetical protein